MAGSREVKSVRPGANRMKLFREEKFEEAINEFTKFLKSTPNDEHNAKVALYNRGMS